MHRRTMSAFVIACLVLASLPWLLASCYEQPLIPPELAGLRAEYEATAEAFRNASLDEMRAAPSGRSLVVVGTVSAGEMAEMGLSEATALPATVTLVPATPRPPTGTPSPTLTASPTATATPTVGVAVRITRATISSVQTVSPRLGSPTARVIRVGAGSATPAPGAPGETAAQKTGNTPQVVTDVITEQMLRDQVRKEVTQTTIRDLSIDLTPDGFVAQSKIVLAFGIQRTLSTTGAFAVEHESLVAKVSNITLGSANVTAQYRSQLEDRINWSLYQLLPQRYVRAFTVSHDEITVTSEMKR